MPAWAILLLVVGILAVAFGSVLVVVLTVKRTLTERLDRVGFPAAAEEEAGPGITARASAPDRCPYCHDALSGVLGACVACGTQHHAECLTENDGCAVLACDAGPKREPPAVQKA